MKTISNLLFLLLVTPMIGQISISGTVYDASTNTTLFGVSVVSSDGSSGTITDEEGNFTLSTSVEKGTLTFSYIGFQSVTLDYDISTQNLIMKLEEDRTTLKEVVVEARRTAKAVSKTSLSITTFGPKEIQSLGITNPTALADYTPGVNSKPTVGGSNPVFTVRGIGFNDFTSIQNPGTSIYVDGVIVPYHTMMGFQMMDIERVEVLKGPQGTLYGRNSTAGAINVYTRGYGKSLNGNVRVDYGSYNTLDLQASIGGPISDNLNFRASVSTYQRFGGYMTNRVNDDDSYGSIDRSAARLRFNWAPSDNFDISLSGHYGKDKSEAVALQHIGTIDAATGEEPCGGVGQGFLSEGPCANAAGYFDDDGDPYAGDYSVTDGGLDNTGAGLNATANLKFGNGLTFTSVTGFEEFDRNQLQDIDASPFAFLDVTFDDYTRSFTQELRLSSDQEKNFRYILGAFTSNDEVNAIQDIDATDLVATRVVVTNNQKSKSFALFGNAELTLNKINILAGLRYSDENKDWNGGSNFIGVGQNIGQNTVDNNDVSGILGVEYTPKEGVFIYANYSTAYRSGGFPGGFTLDPNGLNPFDSEKVFATEIGLKLKSKNGKFNGAIAYYHYDWKGLQTQFSVTDPTTGLAGLFLTNAGDAVINGFETSFSWLPAENFLFSMGLNLMEGTITESTDARLQDKDLANAPNFTFNSLLRWSIPLNKSQLIIQPDVRYTGQRYFTSDNEPIFQDDGYFLLNSRITYQLPNNRNYEISLWGKNLLGAEYRTEAFNQFGFSGDSYFAIGEPITIGVGVALNFL